MHFGFFPCFSVTLNVPHPHPKKSHFSVSLFSCKSIPDQCCQAGADPSTGKDINQQILIKIENILIRQFPCLVSLLTFSVNRIKLRAKTKLTVTLLYQQ